MTFNMAKVLNLGDLMTHKQHLWVYSLKVKRMEGEDSNGKMDHTMREISLTAVSKATVTTTLLT